MNVTVNSSSYPPVVCSQATAIAVELSIGSHVIFIYGKLKFLSMIIVRFAGIGTTGKDTMSIRL